MKKITLLLSFIACVGFMQAQLLVNENFNYTLGVGLVGQGNWLITGTSTTNPITVTASTITYVNYPSSGLGLEVSLANTGQDANCSFTAQTSGTIYVSALVNITAAQTAGDYFIHIADSPTGTTFFGRTFVKLDGTKIAFGIQNTSGGTPTQTYTTSTYDLGTTYLLVLKVNVATGESSLIVNPAMNSEPATGWVTNLSGTGALPAAGFSAVSLRQGSATNAATLLVDGIHVATSWGGLFNLTSFSNPSTSAFDVTVVGKKLLVKNVVNGSTVEIFSALGAKVQSSELIDGKVSLNNLSKGMYIVRVGKNTQKIML